MEETESQGGPGGGVPGGLDVPPDEGGELDIPPEEGDVLPAEEGEAGLPPESDEDAGEIPVEGISGFDYEAEKRVITELRKQGRMDEVKRLVQRWADRLGRPDDPNSREFLSGFDHFIETKELDGLSASTPPSSVEMNGDGQHIHDPNDDNALLVEWSVDATERQEVIDEVRDIITAGEMSVTEDDDDEITPDDIPVSTSRL